MTSANNWRMRLYDYAKTAVGGRLSTLTRSDRLQPAQLPSLPLQPAHLAATACPAYCCSLSILPLQPAQLAAAAYEACRCGLSSFAAAVCTSSTFISVRGFYGTSTLPCDFLSPSHRIQRLQGCCRRRLKQQQNAGRHPSQNDRKLQVVHIAAANPG